MARERIERGGRGRPPRDARPVGAGWRTAGFTLVEVALSLMIFSLGVLAVFLLFGRALNRESDGLRYTRMALFGDSVMEGLQAHSEYLTETASSNEWTQFWEEMASGSTQVICAAASSNGVWDREMSAVAGDVQTNLYYAYPLRSEADSPTGMLSHVIRYRMTVQLTGAVTNISRDLAAVTLKVWDGQFGRAVDEDGMVFYSEFANRGRVE